MAKNTTASIDTNASIVEGYIYLAQGRNASSWEFIKLTKGVSQRVIADSIKQAKSECKISLSDITPTKSQHFPTVLALMAQFPNLESEISFAHAYRIAEKSDRALGATGARLAVKESETFDSFEKSLPKTVREARPNAGTAKVAKFSIDTVLDQIVASGQTMTSADRTELVRKLTATAKLLTAIDKVARTPKATASK